MPRAWPLGGDGTKATECAFAMRPQTPRHPVLPPVRIVRSRRCPGGFLFGREASLQRIDEMAKYSTLVRAAPAGGYRWKVIADGHSLRDGTAPTEFEARSAADEAMKQI